MKKILHGRKGRGRFTIKTSLCQYLGGTALAALATLSLISSGERVSLNNHEDEWIFLDFEVDVFDYLRSNSTTT